MDKKLFDIEDSKQTFFFFLFSFLFSYYLHFNVIVVTLSLLGSFFFPSLPRYFFTVSCTDIRSSLCVYR